MERMGINKNRLRLAWVSAAEGAQFAKVIEEMEHGLHRLKQREIDETAEKFSKALKKKSETT
jgi:coenzyme F420-reducing hydrogenase delta subunit